MCFRRLSPFLLVCMLAAIVLAATPIRSEVPLAINYQGVLHDSLGHPMPDSEYVFSFYIYADSAGEKAAWECPEIRIPVIDGVFSYILGQDCPLPDDLFMDDSARWLGLALEHDPVGLPLTKIVTVPYAFHARRADTALHASSSGSSVWIDDGTVIYPVSVGDSVGIGTDTPVAKLDVAGTINAHSAYSLDGHEVLSDSGSGNLFVGDEAGELNTGVNVTAVGKAAGNHNDGNDNTFVGRSAGYANLSGENNTMVGSQAGAQNSNGNQNTFVGRFAGNANVGETGNTYIGHGTGSTAHGDMNTYVGASAGGISSGSNNVFIGYMAGYNEDNSNRLYISNSSTTTPLIYGDFSTERIGIGTTSPGASLHAYNDAGTGIKAEADGLLASAVYAESHGYGGSGVYGRCDQSSGVGVRGHAGGTNGIAVRGSVSGTSGIAVYGEATGSDVTGVYGTTDSYGCHGVTGFAGSSYGAGVYGESDGVSGAGVWGVATGTVGGRGVYGYGDVGIEAYGVHHAALFYGNVLLRSKTDSTTIMELGEGLDYAEGFDATNSGEIEPGTVMIIDPDNPGKLTVSSEAYDTRVAGIVAGANGLGSGVRLGGDNFDLDVALAGRVYCNVDASQSAVIPGDMLTTSSLPGYAMKAADPARAHGTIIGKAMEPLAKGDRGRILVLVTLQ